MSVMQVFVGDFKHVLNEISLDQEHKRFYDRILGGLWLILNGSREPSRKEYYKFSLLFRNTLDPDRDEALFYIDHVLMKPRTGIANKQFDKPGYIHKLLVRLCALNENPAWYGITISRFVENYFNRIPPLLSQLKSQLNRYCQRSEEARNVAMKRRTLFGCFYLILDDGGVEIPDELSLAEVFNSCPQPLRANFANDERFEHLLSQVIQNLNKRYSYLRSCGLEPQRWFYQEGHQGKRISIKYLLALKCLRQKAMKTDAWIDGKRSHAFKEAFDILFANSDLKKPNVAGFKSFQEWLGSEIGIAMMGTTTIEYDDTQLNSSVYDLPDSIDDDSLAHDPLCEGDELENPDGERLDRDNLKTTEEFSSPFMDNLPGQNNNHFSILVERYPTAFAADLLMHYLFANILDNSGQWRDFVMAGKDSYFKTLLSLDSRYSMLKEEALVDRLWKDTERFVAQKLAQLINPKLAMETKKGKTNASK